MRPEFRLAAGPVHYRLFDPVYETPWMISGRILFRSASGFGFGWGVGYYEIHGVQGIPVMFDIALPGFPAGSVVSPFITLSAYSTVEKGDTGDYDSLPSIPCPPEGCSGGSRNRGWRTQGLGFGACGGIRLEIGEHARLFVEGRAYPIGYPGMATVMVGLDLVP